MEIFTKKAMNFEALKRRKERCVDDFIELMKIIGDSASKGEFDVYFVKSQRDDYPCLSAEQVSTLRKAGFHVHLWEPVKGWDKLHRFYKGGLRITWR